MATRHFDENELTLYYYGEGPRRARVRVERHLNECGACAALYRDISGALGLIVADEVPSRGEQYGREVWQRLRPSLDMDAGFARLPWFSRFSEFIGFGRFAPLPAFITAAATLVIAAFLGAYLVRSRVSEPVNPPQVAIRTNPANAANPANQQTISHRILLTSVADHLDRSERVLTDIMNAAEAGGDISSEQRWADDLLTASRLYRQDARDAGEQSVASVLDDIERSLLEIVHSPSTISAADLEQIRRRIDAAALLFKVRILSDELRERELPDQSRPAARTPTSHTS
jgi:hypothetical protein